jgi:N-methylhydantoinase A
MEIAVRLAIDTGGTFTDLVVEDNAGQLSLYKSPTTPEDPVRGVLDVLDLAARDTSIGREDLLAQAGLFIHATTRAINAILTGHTAKTAFLTTQGHPDVLLFREGGRTDTFNHTQVYPQPYVPRALTYEVPERVGAAAEVVRPLDEAAVKEIIGKLAEQRVEAVAVCLLWSIMNPTHELRIGQLLDEFLPGVPHTLSHALNTTMREYRRASSTAIDASLKPVMTEYLRRLAECLKSAGFGGRVLCVTSAGGMLDADAVAAAPIHSIGSGPAMAPVAGHYYAGVDAGSETAVIADTGGTSYDVSLVRRGHIPFTRETWLGPPYTGHMTGFPSIDVKSIGAGGGSIASVDEGGLLHVGPQSAGAVPGPVCYGRGGTQPTVTDASLVLGYLDPDYFLGGAMRLDVETTKSVLGREIGRNLGLDLYAAAAAVLKVATERMVNAIEDITVNQGVDPRSAVLVAGGGAAGLNAVAIARRLGCPQVIIPQVAAALSAAGALMSDLSTDYAASFWTTSTDFDYERVNDILAWLEDRCHEFMAGPGAGAMESSIEFSVEAHYPHQAWELELPLRVSRFTDPDDVEHLRRDFHALHREVFAVDDPESSVEIIAWRGRVRCRLRSGEPARMRTTTTPQRVPAARQAYWPETGMIETQVRLFDAMEPGEILVGPLIVESPVTTVVIDPGAAVQRTASGSLAILPYGDTRRARQSMVLSTAQGVTR